MARLSIGQAAEKLNKYLEQDPLAFSHLVELRVDCGPLFIANPGLNVHMSFYGRPLMGIVELLNVLFDSSQSLEAVRAGGRVRQFVLKTKKKTTTPEIKKVYNIKRYVK